MIRFGIVGAGNIAHKFAEDITVVPNAKLVAIASSSKKRATNFQQQYNLPYAYDSYEAMAKDDTIDAVYIASPHSNHKAHSILFLKHNKHVLCEKPFTVNKSELQELILIAKESNKVLMEAMWTRFLPAVVFAKKQLDLWNEPIIELHATFSISLLEGYDPTRRLLNPALAGGSLLDVGVYPVSIFRYVLDDPINRISSHATFHETGVDVTNKTDIVLDNDAQTKVTLISGFLENLENQAVIQTKNHKLVIPNFWSSEELIVDGEKHHFPHKKGGFEYEIESFVNTIRDGLNQNPIMTHDASMEIMELLDLIRSEIGLVYPNE